MGNRGKLASETHKSAIACIRPPANLDTNARKFWNKHVKHLVHNDLFAPTEREMFAILCMTYSLLLNAYEANDNRNYNDLLGKFTTLSREFALTPKQRKQQKFTIVEQEERYEDTALFEDV